MRRVAWGLQARCDSSWCCLILFLFSNSTRDARRFFGISLLGLFATVGVGLVVSNYYAVFIAFSVIFIIFLIAFLTAFIAGFRSLADALPMLVEELRGRAPPGGTEVPPCLVRYFGGRAAEVLGRLYSRSLIITFIAIFILIIMSGGLALWLMIGPSLSLNELMYAISLFIKEVSTALGTSVDIALGVLGVVITVVFSLGSLLIGRGAVDAEVLRVVHGVRFHSLTWFSIAITLHCIDNAPANNLHSVHRTDDPSNHDKPHDLPTLATTVIEHMQLPRSNQGD